MFLLCVAVDSTAFAQVALRFEHLGIEDGLSNPIAREIVQDQSGFLWIATEYGLNRFDGQEIRVYEHEPFDATSLPASWISALIADGHGGVWVRLVQPGLTRLGKNGATAFRHDPADPASLGAGHATTWAVDDRGELWIGMQSGAVERFDTATRTFVHVLAAEEAPAPVSTFLADGEGGMWVAFERGGLLQVDAEGRLSRRHGEAELHQEAILSLHRDEPGQLLVVTRSGLRDFDGATGRFRTLDPERAPRAIRLAHASRRQPWLWVASADGLSYFDRATESWNHLPVDAQNEDLFERDSLPAATIQCLQEDREGYLWIGAPHGLLSRDPRTGHIRWHRHRPSDRFGMASGSILSILEDRSGVLWFGTSSGVARFNPRQRWFTHDLYTRRARNVADGFSISAVVEDETGVLWASTLGEGLIIYDKAADEIERLRCDPEDSESISHDGIDAMHLSRIEANTLWIGTRLGVDRLDLTTRRCRRFRDESGGVRAMWQDRRGTLWVGRNTGLDRMDPETGALERVPCRVDGPGGIDRCQVFSIYESPDGMLWFGVVPTGLHRYDPVTEEFHHYAVPGPGSALVPHTIHSMYESPDGLLWLGTFSDGLVCLDRKTERFTAITQADGLPSNRVVSVLPDDDGTLWLGSNRGLIHFDPTTRLIRRFHAADGLQSDQFWEAAATRRRTGEFVFAGVDGITTFRSEQVGRNQFAPKLALVGLEVLGRDGARGLDLPDEGETVQLDRRESSLAFRFAVLDFTVPGQNDYAYRLQGYDESWTQGASEGTYRNLPPGEYRLQLRGANSDGVWNQAGIEIAISVLPAFWQRSWFHVLLASLAVATIWLLHRTRMRIATARERELVGVRQAVHDRVREDAARDLHDELGHLVSRISLSSGIARRKLTDDPSAARRHLDQLVSSSRALAEAMGDFLWTLDARSDSVAEAVVRLKDSGDELFRGTGIRFEMRGLTRELDGVRLPVDRKRNMTMMFKEAMNNAFKHAGASEVLLEVTLGSDDLRLSLSDDGHGFEADGDRGGRGLSNMRNRAARLGGSLEIRSNEGQGTRVELRLPRSAIANNGGGS